MLKRSSSSENLQVVNQVGLKLDKFPQIEKLTCLLIQKLFVRHVYSNVSVKYPTLSQNFREVQNHILNRKLSVS